MVWQFINDKGDFRYEDVPAQSCMYFPLFNQCLLSYITPEFQGDIMRDFDHYLTVPTVQEEMHRNLSSRNVWLACEEQVWSATGLSAAHMLEQARGRRLDTCTVEGGRGWFRTIRHNPDLEVLARVTAFIPSGQDAVEILLIDIENLGCERAFNLTYSIPLFGRRADNLRDHREMSTYMNRFIDYPDGVVLKPTAVHDERGHRLNQTHYAVLGTGRTSPAGGWRDMKEFIGGGTLAAPEAVLKNIKPPALDSPAPEGRDAVGALSFSPFIAGPGERARYVVIQAITDDINDLDGWFDKYSSYEKASVALEQTRRTVAQTVDRLQVFFPEEKASCLLRWISYQPLLRAAFGCSYLPEYSYGRGNRGWRDLWQDMLGLLLINPEAARGDICNHFAGVRLDGSNATIIGTRPGEFLSDRNNIARVWSDHGIWPYVTTRFYIDFTGDLDILLEKITYFADTQLRRARAFNSSHDPALGYKFITSSGKPYSGTVLEHLLIQTLTSFFNVGRHNITLVEGADWDDTMDMARTEGETVHFMGYYGANLRGLSQCLRRLVMEKGVREITIAGILTGLLDRVFDEAIDYESWQAKRDRLEKYFDRMATFDGSTVTVEIDRLCMDLEEKARHITGWINSHEWVTTKNKESFYASYYDNLGRRLDGDRPGGRVGMILTAQAYLLLAGVPEKERVAALHKAARRYLYEPKFKAFRLKTDFNDLSLVPVMGRNFGMAYGNRENGSFYSHMIVKYAAGLYHNGFVREGWEVLQGLIGLALDAGTNRRFPALAASYHSASGQATASYLTGSASWFVFTIITEVFGLRGEFGDLCLEPKLVAEQFDSSGQACLCAYFAGQPLEVVIYNPQRLDFGCYRISAAKLNDEDISNMISTDATKIRIPRAEFLKRLDKANLLTVNFSSN